MRTATIITDRPHRDVARALMDGLGHGVSRWDITGGYTDETHGTLLCTVYRFQVNDVKLIVAAVDPTAFLVIGIAHQAPGFQLCPVDGLNSDTIVEARKRTSPAIRLDWEWHVNLGLRHIERQ